MTDAARSTAGRRTGLATTLAAGLLAIIAVGAARTSDRDPATRGEPREPGGIAATWTDLEWRRIRTLTPLGPPPADPTNRFAEDPEAAAFGQRMFFDRSFSVGLPVSCASCHDPDLWFTDGADFSMAADLGVRNAQSVLDTAHQRWLFWDGRSDSQWAQAIEPFENEREYDSTRLAVVRRLATEPGLRADYEAAIGPLPPADWFAGLPEHATPLRAADHPHRQAWDALRPADQETINMAFAGLGKAIAAYERRLQSGSSAFDAYVADLQSGGDGGEHLTPSAVRGLRLFIDRADCRTCHLGPRFSDGVFHATGVPTTDPGLGPDAGRAPALAIVQNDPFNAAGSYSDDPDGPRARFVQSSIGTPEDYAAFRTPSLRNVAMTGPYMHAGQMQSLEEVVRFYSTLEGAQRFDHHGQTVLRRLDLTEDEIADLVSFLESLTGPLPPEELLRPPARASRD